MLPLTAPAPATGALAAAPPAVPAAERPAARWARFTAGCAVIAAAVTVLLALDRGVDAYGVLVAGVARQSGRAFGTAAAVTGLALVLAWGLCRRARVGLGSVVVGPLSGWMVNLLSPVRTSLAGLAHWPIAAQLPTALVASVVLGAGAGLALGADLGPGPVEGTGVTLAAWTRLPLGRALTGVLLVFLVTGWVLGGTVGWATALLAVVVGPVTAAVAATSRRWPASRAVAAAPLL